MSRARGNKQYLSLPKGLITEANPLAFPEGATQDEINFLLDTDGIIRKRRKGLSKLVPDFVASKPLGSIAKVDNVYYWKQPDLILVIYTTTLTPQTIVRIHKNDLGFTLVDSFVLATRITKTQIAETTNTVVLSLGDSVSQDKPVLFEFDEVANEINIFTVDIFVRDFELVDDDLQVSGRPVSLTDEHEYNLLNAGWYAARRLESTNQLGDPIEEFANESGVRTLNATFTATSTISGLEDISLATLTNGDSIIVAGSGSNNGTFTVSTATTIPGIPQTVTIVVQEVSIVNESSVSITLTTPKAYPSNADIALLGTKADTNGIELFSADTLKETVLGSTEAPRGHYVFNINAFDRNTRLASPSTDGTADSTITLEVTIPL